MYFNFYYAETFFFYQGLKSCDFEDWSRSAKFIDLISNTVNPI
jgi:hypothetical protein